MSIVYNRIIEKSDGYGFQEYDETTYAGPPLLSNVLKIKQGLKL